MFDGRRARGGAMALFYITSVIVTHFLLINTLVGLMLSEFRTKTFKDQENAGEEYLRQSVSNIREAIKR